MFVSAVFKGFGALDKKIQAMHKQIDAPMIKTLGEAALIVHGEAIKSIQDKSNSITKRVGGKSIMVSKPGNPPNTQTGRLVKSIRWELNKEKLKALVGSKLDYASFLEFGTSVVAARPWLRPAFLKHSDFLRELFRKNMSRAIRKLGGK
jgi:HK97 gp10 family phage protein